MLCPNSFSASEAEAPKQDAQLHVSMDLGKIWQGVLNLPPSYTIEVISEIYDKMRPEDQEKTLIHELMHIPGGFGGGFVPTKALLNAKTWKPSTRNSHSDGMLKIKKPCFSSKSQKTLPFSAISF